MAGDLIRWKPCCAFTACSIGYNLSDGAMEDALYEIILQCVCLPVIPG